MISRGVLLGDHGWLTGIPLRDHRGHLGAIGGRFKVHSGSFQGSQGVLWGITEGSFRVHRGSFHG